MKPSPFFPFFPFFLAATMLSAAGANAQKVCHAANERVKFTYPATASSWFALETTAKQTMAVTAVSFRLLASPSAASTQLGIWNENASTKTPGTLLASGTVSLPRNVPGWYVAKLNRPVLILKGQRFFVAARLVNGIRPGTSRSGTINRHYWGGGPWRGPFPSLAWGHRLYCGTGTGQLSTFGVGKRGTAGVPGIAADGFASIGGTVSVRVWQARGGAAGILVLGPRIPSGAPFPFGTAYAFPAWFALPIQFPASGLGAGSTTIDLPLQDNPSWVGFSVAMQGWIVDAAAAAGLAHTPGLWMRIGK